MFAFFVVYLISAPPRRRAPAAAGAMYPYTLAAGVRKRGCEMYKTKTMLDKYTRTSQKNSEIKLDLSWIQSQGQSLRASGGPSRGSRVLDWFLNLPFEYGISTFDSESFEPRSHWESSGHLIPITSLTTRT